METEALISKLINKDNITKKELLDIIIKLHTRLVALELEPTFNCLNISSPDKSYENYKKELSFDITNCLLDLKYEIKIKLEEWLMPDNIPLKKYNEKIIYYQNGWKYFKQIDYRQFNNFIISKITKLLSDWQKNHEIKTEKQINQYSKLIANLLKHKERDLKNIILESLD